MKRGHQVEILTSSIEGPASKETVGGAVVHRIRSMPNPFRRSPRLVVAQPLKINKIFEKFQPDIIHIQDVGGCSAAGLRWGRENQVPVVGTRHFSTSLVASYVPLNEILPKEPLHRAIEALAQDAYVDCTVVTCPTQSLLEDLQARDFPTPLEVVTNGVDIPALPDLKKRLAKKPPIVLTVSRIDDDKNIKTLLEAAPLVQAKHPAQFVIIGSGDKLAGYQKYVEKRELGGYVHFTGALPNASTELKRWFAEAQVFALPSLVETQSIVTMEAMALGLPIVAIDACAIPELVKTGKTGHLVKRSDPQLFAAGILAMLDNPEAAQKLGQQGRKLVQKEHSRKHAVNQLLAVYQKALDGAYRPIVN